MDNFDEIWDQVTAISAENLIELPTEILLPNSKKSKEYILTHKLRNSRYAFKAREGAQTSLFIKIIPCSSFEELKAIHKRLKSSANSEKIKEATLDVQDSFETYDQGQWCMILVTEWLDCISLKTISTANLTLSRDSSLLVFTSIFSIYNTATRYNITLSPSTVLICRRNRTYYRIGVSLTTRTCDSHSIFSILQHLVGVPPLSNFKNTVLKHFDPAVSLIFEKCEDKDKQSELTIHRIVRAWTSFLTHDWLNIENLSLKELVVLHSGLLLNSSQSREMALHKLLELSAENPAAVNRYLNSYNAIEALLFQCASFDWGTNAYLYNGFLALLICNLKRPEVKEAVARLELMPNMVIEYFFPDSLTLVLDMIEIFITNHTLTLLQMIYDNGIINRIPRIPQTDAFFRRIMPFLGPHSIDFMVTYGNNKDIPRMETIEQMIEVPHFFKFHKLQYIFNYLHSALERIKKSNKDNQQILLSNSLILIANICCVPYILQTANSNGLCPSHDFEFMNNFRCSQQFLIECKDCCLTLCQTCFLSLHMNHSFEYVYYQKKHLECMCNEIHPKEECKLNFALPDYQTRVEFEDSNGLLYYESYGQTFTGSYGSEIMTRGYLTNLEKQIHYFEVNIIRAGSKEDLEICEDVSKISYKTTNGHLFVGNLFVMKCPRVGSYDTVGIGFTLDAKAFVTVNGFIVLPMIDHVSVDKIRPRIVMNGNDCEVKIEIRFWLFQRAQYLPTRVKDLLMILEKPVRKFKGTITNQYHEILSFLKISH